MFSFFILFSVKKFAKKDFFTIFVARLIGYSDMKSILRVFTTSIMVPDSHISLPITTVSISCHAILVTIAWGLTVSIIYG